MNTCVNGLLGEVRDALMDLAIATAKIML